VDEHNDDEGIRDVLREERGRGRRPVDTEAEHAERELKDGYRRLISAGATEEEFRDGLIALGWSPDSPEFHAFLRQWRAIQRARRSS
jgi:hypothetical protein